MKKFKKLIPALCMLLISAVLMGTSTYAWFSMNKKVTVDGMEVSAKTNSRYLLIGTENNAQTIIKDNLTTVSPTIAAGYTTTVYPCAFTTTAIAKTGVDQTGNWVEANSWYTANSKDNDKSNENVENYSPFTIDGTQEKEYMAKYESYLLLSKASENLTGGTLTVTLHKDAVSEQQNNAAVSVYVVVDGYTLSNNGIIKNADGTVSVSNFSLTSVTPVKVTIYVFIDGTDEIVTSKNVNGGMLLVGNIDVQFDIESND